MFHNFLVESYLIVIGPKLGYQFKVPPSIFENHFLILKHYDLPICMVS